MKTVKYAMQGPVAVVTISRPKQRNAFTEELADDLIAAVSQASLDGQVKAIVLTGDPAGSAFCAGADLGGNGAQFSSPQPPSGGEYRDGGGRVGLAILQSTKPVIAAINGAAVGVGLTMPCCCDIRVAAEDAKVGFPFVRRGLAAETISSWTLPRLVGMGKAQELVLTGRVFLAKDAPAGLFNYVVPQDQVLAKALELAREICDNGSPYSLALSRNVRVCVCVCRRRLLGRH
jgi:enoyl-CoA hydratase/carnithine racemase